MKTKYVFFIILALASFVSCTENGSLSLDNELTDEQDVLQTDISTDVEVLALDEIDSEEFESMVSSSDESEKNLKGSQTYYYNVGAIHGCPSITSYVFLIRDYGKSPLRKVVFQSPDRKLYVITMRRYNPEFQALFVRMNMPGRWYFSYIDAFGNRLEPNRSPYYRDNTVVSINTNATSQLVWPFPNKDCWTMTCGEGCNAHTTANNEYYAQDWACTYGSEGEDFFSPLDGKVENVVYNHASYGNYVDLVQFVGSKKVRFRIAHLSSISVSKNEYVQSSKSKIGEVGNTGNSTGPHAHCSLFDISNGKKSIPFSFNATCNTIF